ncbi:putative acylphosphatase-2-like [Triplophysa rosa]|uniref:Acylphosphatase-2-like n=1 Tax=Triplophysa rosa TaxID=992332 RepID=A0A9W7WBZ4_TRIRA|nr:putative acylphosphatase-2-like [Triplophysa rosa]
MSLISDKNWKCTFIVCVLYSWKERFPVAVLDFHNCEHWLSNTKHEHHTKYWLSKVGSPSSRIDRAQFSNERDISKLEIHGFGTRY